MFSTGNAGGWLLYAALGTCAVTMFFMMRGMGGMGGGQHRGEMDGDRPENSTDKPTRNAGLTIVDSPNPPAPPVSQQRRSAHRDAYDRIGVAR